MPNPDNNKIAASLTKEAKASNTSTQKAYRDAVRRKAIEMVSNKGQMSASAAEKAIDGNSKAYSGYMDLAKRAVREAMATGKHHAPKQGESSHK